MTTSEKVIKNKLGLLELSLQIEKMIRGIVCRGFGGCYRNGL